MKLRLIKRIWDPGAAAARTGEGTFISIPDSDEQKCRRLINFNKLLLFTGGARPARHNCDRGSPGVRRYRSNYAQLFGNRDEAHTLCCRNAEMPKCRLSVASYDYHELEMLLSAGKENV